MFDADEVKFLDEAPTLQRLTYEHLGWRRRGSRIIWDVKRSDGRRLEAETVWAPPCGGARVYGKEGAYLGHRQCPNPCQQIYKDLGPGNFTPYFTWGCGDCIAYEREQFRRMPIERGYDQCG